MTSSYTDPRFILIERVKGRRDMNLRSAQLHQESSKREEFYLNMDAVEGEVRAQAYDNVLQDIIELLFRED